MGDVLYLLNWADMSRKYFGKSTAWLYHKLNSIDRDGNPCVFTEEEFQQLKDSFRDLASKLNTLAETLNIDD